MKIEKEKLKYLMQELKGMKALSTSHLGTGVLKETIDFLKEIQNDLDKGKEAIIELKE